MSAECEFGQRLGPASRSCEQYRYTVPVVNKADALTRFLAPYISVAGVMIDHKYRVIYSDWGGMVSL